jgi:acyl-CoA oxidase
MPDQPPPRPQPPALDDLAPSPTSEPKSTPTDTTTPATLRALQSQLHPHISAPAHHHLRELFNNPSFAVRRNQSREESSQLAYDQLRALNEELGPGTELLADPDRLFALFSWVGLADPALAFVALVHYCLALATVVAQRDQAGSDGAAPPTHPHPHLRDLDELSSVGSFLITEPSRGSSHVATRTEARYDAARDEFVLHTPSPLAAKLANAALPGVPKLGVVFARLKVQGRDRGVFAFAVPLRDTRGPRPGIRLEALPGMPMLAADSCLVTFDHVRVPRADWLPGGAEIDGTGTFHDGGLSSDARLVHTMAAGSFCWPAQSVALAAAARGCVAIALRYASERTTMGRQSPRLPAIAHRNQHRPLLGALAEAYAITFLANESARSKANDVTRREFSGHDDAQSEPLGAATAATPWTSVNRESALTKALVADALQRVAERCRRSYGALGLMTANRILDYQFLGHAFQFAGGDGQLILLDTARALAAGPAPRPPAEIEGGLEQGKVHDLDFLQALAAAREHRAHQHVVELTQRSERCGETPQQTWNEQYDVALDLARAHGAALILAANRRVVTRAKATDEQAARLLEDLCTLHALETVHAEAGWLLANKLLTPSQALEIPDALNDVCTRLLPHAPSLIDAFDIPDPLLGTVAFPPRPAA